MAQTQTQAQSPAPNFEDVWRSIQALAQTQQETSREIQKTSQEVQETSRQIRELKKQIGGLGDKFGYFTEGMALPSMERLLRDRFGMENIAPRHRVRRGGEAREYDVLSWANGATNTAIIVEVKSRVRAEAITQLSEQLDSLFRFLPELAGKHRIGILAGIDWDRGLEEEAQSVGLYTARIHDEIFELTVPEGFAPQNW